MPDHLPDAAERVGPYRLGVVHRADCLEGMAALPAGSVDAVVTDPPYGLSFMGQGWDHGVPGADYWRDALRVAKPGAHLLAFGGTRTFHRLACAIEDAGWEIRDTLMWVYGSGFPKSLDVSKAIDKAAGLERPRVPGGCGTAGKISTVGLVPGEAISGEAISGEAISGEAISGEARRWQGWGTALKPAWEPVILARKPLEGTVAANVLKHGTGALNIDGGRIEIGAGINGFRMGDYTSVAGEPYRKDQHPQGRWPANLLHDGSPEVLAGFPNVTTGNIKPYVSQDAGMFGMMAGKFHVNSHTGDSGSAARFFYTAKASRSEREAGLEGPEIRGAGTLNLRMDTKARNHHPTVKPLSLMRYLCRLVTPPGGLVLDPFAGSGSTLCAAELEGFRALGFDLEAEYAAIANARLAYWRKHPEGPAYDPDPEPVHPGQGQLFGGGDE